jgi:hypothetical protein
MKKIIFLAFLLSLIPCITLAGPVSITLAWTAVPDADGGYEFFLKSTDVATGTIGTGNLIEIGTAAAGTTTVTLPLTLPNGKYTIHAVSRDIVGNQSDLSLPATLNDTTTVVYLTKPGKVVVKIRTR